MNIKTKLEERLKELYQAAQDTEAQLWAIRGAIQEVETVIMPLIEEPGNDGNEDADEQTDNSD